MTVYEVLHRAADHIEQYGWIQGSSGLGLDDGPRCALGAIATASGEIVNCYDFEFTGGVRMEAVRALRRHIGSDDIAGWNDTRGRTAADVVTALRVSAEVTP
ncbi:MAG TPA: hypothetical protein VFO62_10635 [Candidatus Binatia bacterium]|nr:hypothetical protein [Candidatus Binatia bacterium]